jgi:uncharacterized protein (TIRG00374 family)
VNALKILIVIGLLTWMVQTGKLSLTQMSVFVTQPLILIVGTIAWLIGPVLLGTWRWWLLVRGAGLECRFLRALQLQLVGFFFNTAMPGAVGGDIVKAIYIVRDQNGPSGKTPALLSVVLDRIVGLIGLFTMGASVALLNYQSLVENPSIAKLVNGLIFVFALSCLFLILVFIPYKQSKDPFEKILKRSFPGFRMLLGIYLALRQYRHDPKRLFLTIGISICLQIMFMSYMGFVGQVLYPDQFDSSLLPTVFPFGILVTAIPLAPGGLGVGHAAFERLFSIVGLPGGANVFNIFTLSQLALNLLCFIPYLLIRKNEPFNLEQQIATFE